MVLGIDLDEVCADFIGGFTARAGIVLGRQMGSGAWEHWPIHQSLNIPKDDVATVWDDIERRGLFWQNLSPLPGVLGAFVVLEEWIRNGTAEVVFITSRPHASAAHTRKESQQWVAKYGISDPYVIVTEDKPSVVRALEVTHFIDDRYANVRGVADGCPGVWTFLVDAPYNAMEIAKESRKSRSYIPISGLPGLVDCLRRDIDLHEFRAAQWATRAF